MLHTQCVVIHKTRIGSDGTGYGALAGLYRAAGACGAVKTHEARCNLRNTPPSEVLDRRPHRRSINKSRIPDRVVEAEVIREGNAPSWLVQHWDIEVDIQIARIDRVESLAEPVVWP